MERFADLMNNIYLPMTILIGLLGTFGTIITTLINVILKTNRQKVLIKNQTIESQINLIKVFIDLLSIVDGRQKTEISKEFIEGMIGKVSSIKNEKEINLAIEYIRNNAFFTQPIGKASQNAIASALFNFGINNDILLEPALVGLKELNGKTINISNENPLIDDNIKTLESKLSKKKKT